MASIERLIPREVRDDLNIYAYRKEQEGMKHTSGPLHVVDCRHQKNGQIRIWSQSHHVANVLASGSNPDADARLFAAAPDLLEACVQARAALPAAWLAFKCEAARNGLRDVIELLDAAIAKAEGREERA